MFIEKNYNLRDLWGDDTFITYGLGNNVFDELLFSTLHHIWSILTLQNDVATKNVALDA